jgi:hypothetical protein
MWKTKIYFKQVKDCPWFLGKKCFHIDRVEIDTACSEDENSEPPEYCPCKKV